MNNEQASTKSFKRLLVPVDTSDQSQYAVEVAARMAAQLGANVLLLHVCVFPPLSDPQMGFIEPDVHTLCIEAADAILAAAKAKFPSACHVDTDIREGNPATEILKSVELRNIDLIIMGTHARGRLAQAMLGSVARAVTQQATCPVLTVARPSVHHALQHEFEDAAV